MQTDRIVIKCQRDGYLSVCITLLGGEKRITTDLCWEEALGVVASALVPGSSGIKFARAPALDRHLRTMHNRIVQKRANAYALANGRVELN